MKCKKAIQSALYRKIKENTLTQNKKQKTKQKGEIAMEYSHQTPPSLPPSYQ
jgi:hypothetical protein